MKIGHIIYRPRYRKWFYRAVAYARWNLLEDETLTDKIAWIESKYQELVEGWKARKALS